VRREAVCLAWEASGGCISVLEELHEALKEENENKVTAAVCFLAQLLQAAMLAACN